MGELDRHIAALEAEEADERTLAIYNYFKALRRGNSAQQSDAFHKATRLTRKEAQQWEDTPVPDMTAYAQLREGYRAFPIDVSHPRFSDGYVDVRDLGLRGKNFYFECGATTYPYKTKIDGAIPHLLVRDTVAHFLLIADHMLKQLGLGIYVYDAWRPAEVQASLYKWFEGEILKKNPSLAGPALEKEVVKFVSKPPMGDDIDPMSPAPHLTGGAVDIAIIDQKTGKPIFTGVPFDEFTSISAPDYYEKKLQEAERAGKVLSDEDMEALKNVRVTFHLMASLGFVPLDSENWHFELFTQNWAKTKGLEAGFYGAMFPDLKKFDNRPWMKAKTAKIRPCKP